AGELVGFAAVASQPFGASAPDSVSVITPLVLKCVLLPPAASLKSKAEDRRATNVLPAVRRPALILNSGVGKCRVIVSGEAVVDGCSALWAWIARTLRPVLSSVLTGPRMISTGALAVLTLNAGWLA